MTDDMDPLSQIRNTALLAFVGAMWACSGHSSEPRVLVSHLDLGVCATDEAFIYVSDGGAVSRVDRKTGEATMLTNDTRGVSAMRVADGSFFWIDSDGVHEWQKSATTRATVADIPFGHAGNTLARFGDELCWTKHDDSGGVVDCLDLTARTVRTVYHTATVAEVASEGTKLFVADYAHGETTIRDITDPASPTELLHVPSVTVGFTTSPDGPLAFEVGSDRNPHPKLWVASRPARSVPLPGDGGLVTVVGRRAFWFSSTASLRPIDLKTGTPGNPLPSVRPNRGACGDDAFLYAAGSDGSILEFRNH